MARKKITEATTIRYVRTRLANYIKSKPIIRQSYIDMLKAACIVLSEIEETKTFKRNDGTTERKNDLRFADNEEA